MSGPWPVAVVIPARNVREFVLDAVESALHQEHPPAEVVVVDDGSTDGTGEAVEQRFGAGETGRAGPLVRVIRGRFGSAAAARNAGWRAATAPWVAFLDADDIWFPNKLSTAEAVLRAVPEADWFFSDGTFQTREGDTWPSWLGTWADMPETYAGHPVAGLIEVNFILTSSVVARRDLLEALQGFDERFSHAEDLDLWIRLARRAPAAASRRPLVRYQHRDGGLAQQVTSRLLGDITLFQRLAGDPTLSPPLRRRARRREALAHFKLAAVALREGRGAEARRHLRAGWMFPERAIAVIGAWLVSLLPNALVRGLRRHPWATRRLASPTLAHQRVTLRAEPALIRADRRAS